MIIPYSQLYICVQWKAISPLGKKHIRVMKYDLMNTLFSVANHNGMHIIGIGDLPFPLLMVLELTIVNPPGHSTGSNFACNGAAFTNVYPGHYSWQKGVGFVTNDSAAMEHKKNEQEPLYLNHPVIDHWLENLSVFNRAYEDDLVLDFSLESGIPRLITRNQSERSIAFSALSA